MGFLMDGVMDIFIMQESKWKVKHKTQMQGNDDKIWIVFNSTT
jgi:hypothetical protein